jgi:hypothetical protein
MQKWEYLTVKTDRDIASPNSKVLMMNGTSIDPEEYKSFHTLLKVLGEEGWELVSTEIIYFYFKRPME